MIGNRLESLQASKVGRASKWVAHEIIELPGEIWDSSVALGILGGTGIAVATASELASSDNWTQKAVFGVGVLWVVLGIKNDATNSRESQRLKDELFDCRMDREDGREEVSRLRRDFSEVVGGLQREGDVFVLSDEGYNQLLSISKPEDTHSSS